MPQKNGALVLRSQRTATNVGNVANDHYVSQFQIRSWIPRGKSKVLVYLCDEDRLQWIHPKPLFAIENLNEPAIETRLNQLIESPLTQQRSELLESHSANQPPWRVYRAAWLLMLVQNARTSDALQITGGSTLHSLLSRTEQQLDELVHAAASSYNLIRFHHQSDLLFLPSVGHFAVPMRDRGCPTGMSWAICFPVSARTLFVMASKTAYDLSDDVFALTKTTPLGSIGSGPHLNKVVVPPSWIDAIPKQRDLVERIRLQRALARDQQDGFIEIRREARSMYEDAGITLESVSGGGPLRIRAR